MTISNKDLDELIVVAVLDDPKATPRQKEAVRKYALRMEKIACDDAKYWEGVAIATQA